MQPLKRAHDVKEMLPQVLDIVEKPVSLTNLLQSNLTSVANID